MAPRRQAANKTNRTSKRSAAPRQTRVKPVRDFENEFAQKFVDLTTPVQHAKEGRAIDGDFSNIITAELDKKGLSDNTFAFVDDNLRHPDFINEFAEVTVNAFVNQCAMIIHDVDVHHDDESLTHGLAVFDALKACAAKMNTIFSAAKNVYKKAGNYYRKHNNLATFKPPAKVKAKQESDDEDEDVVENTIQERSVTITADDGEQLDIEPAPLAFSDDDDTPPPVVKGRGKGKGKDKAPAKPKAPTKPKPKVTVTSVVEDKKESKRKPKKPVKDEKAEAVQKHLDDIQDSDSEPLTVPSFDEQFDEAKKEDVKDADKDESNDDTKDEVANEEEEYDLVPPKDLFEAAWDGDSDEEGVNE
jgi:hypothetical protein